MFFIIETKEKSKDLIIYYLNIFIVMKQITHLINLMRRLKTAFVCFAVLATMASCTSDDEPEVGIDYYLQIESRVPIKSSGGIAPPPKGNMIGILTSEMKKRIKEVYPVRDMQGDDTGVMIVCDEVYRDYQDANIQTNCECVAILYRARMSGDIVKGCVKLKTYRF